MSSFVAAVLTTLSATPGVDSRLDLVASRLPGYPQNLPEGSDPKMVSARRDAQVSFIYTTEDKLRAVLASYDAGVSEGTRPFTLVSARSQETAGVPELVCPRADRVDNPNTKKRTSKPDAKKPGRQFWPLLLRGDVQLDSSSITDEQLAEVQATVDETGLAYRVTRGSKTIILTPV